MTDDPTRDEESDGGNPGQSADRKPAVDGNNGDPRPGTDPRATSSPRDTDHSDKTGGDDSEGDEHGGDSDDNASSMAGDGESATERRDGAAPTIRVEDIDRVFSLLEETIADENLQGQQVDQLLSILERGVIQLGETDPDEVADLVTLLEELILEPDELDQGDIAGVLSVFETALEETTGGGVEGSGDLLAVLDEAVRDPAGIEPEDVERFQSGVGDALSQMTGSQGLGQLFTLPGFGTQRRDAPAEEIDFDSGDDGVDPFRVARLAAAMTQQATGNSAQSGVRAGTRLAYAAANAGSPAELLTQTRALTLAELQQAGVNIGPEQQRWLEQHEDEVVDGPRLTREQLRTDWERLLSRSAELDQDESLHPAFPAIIDQLAADEARILRLLAAEGPQPAISVYERGYVPFRTHLVAPHLTRMGGDAGCRQPERTQVYTTNLERLGLVEFREDTVENMKAYQVLEAQPQVEAAMEEARWPKTVYGVARLTDLGIEFCEVVLSDPVEGHRKSSRFWPD